MSFFDHVSERQSKYKVICSDFSLCAKVMKSKDDFYIYNFDASAQDFWY
jgi:hypothetical protein